MIHFEENGSCDQNFLLDTKIFQKLYIFFIPAIESQPSMVSASIVAAGVSKLKKTKKLSTESTKKVSLNETKV